jgi:hypothetical protein
MVQIVCLPVPTIFLLHTMVVPAIFLPESTLCQLTVCHSPMVMPTTVYDCYIICLLYTNGCSRYLPYTTGCASYLSTLHQWLCHLSICPAPMVVPAICPLYTNGCANYLTALHQWLCQLSVRPTPLVVPTICLLYTTG